MRFGSDGHLYVSTGDGASFTAVDELALRSQSLTSLGRKILRVTTNGKGVSSNPFWNGNRNSTISKSGQRVPQPVPRRDAARIPPSMLF